MFKSASSRAALTILLSAGAPLWLITGCQAHITSAASRPNLDSLAGDYVRLAVSLGEHDPDTLDFSIAPATWTKGLHDHPDSLAVIHTQSNALIADLDRLQPRDPAVRSRIAYLTAQLQALACAADNVSGHHRSFDDESRCFFDIPAYPTPDAVTLNQVRRELDRLLPGRGDLATRLDRYERRFLIPPQHLRAVMLRALAGCRTQTLSHLTLPADEHADLELVGDQPWAGYSTYLGHHHSLIRINTDSPLTVNRSLDLACHEGYPGHHTFNLLRDDALVSRTHLPEMTVQLTFSPQSFLSEGAANLATKMAFTPAERARFERTELLPLAGLPDQDLTRSLQIEALLDQLQPAVIDIARQYLDGSLEFARASRQLEDRALMPHNFDTLKYLNEFRSYVLAYTYAPALLQQQLACSPDRGWPLYTLWMTTQTTKPSLPEAQSNAATPRLQ